MRIRAIFPGFRAGLGLCLGLLAAGPAAARVAAPGVHADFGTEAASGDTRRLADWVVGSEDAQGLPFLIVDKVEARVFAFDQLGRLRRSAPVLLGAARGDVATPGIGNRRLADISPAERITPAGRFEAAFGHNLAGKDILWVDYGTAISLHRVVTGNAAERRLERLATATTRDNRVSYGCINVPATYYEDVVRHLFAATGGIVYVMPEIEPMEDVFAMSASTGVGSSGQPR